MGKKRKLQVHQDQGESMTQDERKLKEKLMDKIEEKYDEKVATIRATHYPRWREICEVGPSDPIDKDNPYVHLEWFLCDFKVQYDLMNGNRDKVLEQMDDMQR